MRNGLRVALVTPEAAPFAKSGELAEFCAALPRYLNSLGLKTSLIMPRYSTPQIASLDAVVVFPEISIPLNGERARASVLRAEQNGYEIYLIDSPKYFLRENIYGPPTGNYLDNDERFVFFSRAAVEFLRQAGFPLDVVHCHNWPTALIPVFLRSHYGEDPVLKSVATVLTLHNTAYQGEFPAESLALTELGWDFFSPRHLPSNGKINFLQAAARRFPGRVAFRFVSNPVLTHKIMAGADILLIPSLTEPSGLNLFAAFRYGTVPVVRATGGLKEAVRAHNARTGSGNGFIFHDYSAQALFRAVGQAADCYTGRPAHWRKLVEEGMRQEFSWEDTARGYAELYQKALEIKRGG